MKTLKITLMLMVALAGNLANAKVVRLANISLGYGKLDVGAGNGYISALTDSKNQLLGISVKALADLFGIESNISKYIEVGSLAKGESQRFLMDGGKSAILVIKPKGGFTGQGGQIQLSILTTVGYIHENLEITKGAQSGQYRIYRGEQMINQIDLNLRGYSVAEMKVGWYDLKSE